MIGFLIEGETGTGKDELARFFLGKHFTSGFIEAGVEFVETLIASQLFGHLAGDHTDAKTNRPGLFQIAAIEAKMILLNEINSYPLSVQFRLLRFLERR